MSDADNDDVEFKNFVLRSYPGVLEIEPVLEAAEKRVAPKWCAEYEQAEQMGETGSRRR